jgi:hypothetical protein
LLILILILLHSTQATLELSNAGENSSSQSCSTVLFAGLYWTKSSATLLHQDKFNLVLKTVNTNSTVGHTQSITDSNYSLTIIAGSKLGGSLAYL